MRVADAPVHVRQILEILRLLYRGADVLILDEPTAVLAPAQIEELLNQMRKLKAEGRTILFVSHKLDEVMSMSDAITVMRAGRVVMTTRPARITVIASDMLITSSSLWLTNRIVRPSAFSLRIWLSSSSICAGASTAVGSSRISTSAPR